MLKKTGTIDEKVRGRRCRAHALAQGSATGRPLCNASMHELQFPACRRPCCGCGLLLRLPAWPKCGLSLHGPPPPGRQAVGRQGLHQWGSQRPAASHRDCLVLHRPPPHPHHTPTTPPDTRTFPTAAAG